jgi:hypothetical protein
LLFAIPRPEVDLQGASKQLQQNLETHLRDRGIVPPLTQLISNERMLRPRDLVPAKHHSLLSQRLPNQIPPLGRDVVVQRAMDERQLALDLGCAGQRVVSFVKPQGVTVEVGGEVADGGGYAGVQCAAVGEVPAETHACGADATGTGGEGEQVGDGEGGVFVVSFESLDFGELVRR